MATGGHITSIGAALYSDLAVAAAGTDWGADAALPGTPTSSASWFAFFANVTDNANYTAAASATGCVRIPDVREFPAFGTPPNIVKVPIFGQKTSQQIQGQADAPQLEVTINYKPAMWASGTTLGGLIGDGRSHLWRFTLLNSEPASYASSAAGLGTDPNSQWFWVGKLEALLVKPSLSDATTATLTLSLQSDLYGSFSNTGT